jgi:hypothetical protein
MGGTTPTSGEEEMPTLIRQAWCRAKVAAPPLAGMHQANYLTTPNLKQFSISLEEKAANQICSQTNAHVLRHELDSGMYELFTKKADWPY